MRYRRPFLRLAETRQAFASLPGNNLLRFRRHALRKRMLSQAGSLARPVQQDRIDVGGSTHYQRIICFNGIIIRLMTSSCLTETSG